MGNARDVVVTGMGAVTSVGVGVESYRQAIREGRTGLAPVGEDMDAADLPVKLVGMVPGFDPHSVLEPKQARLAARGVQYAVSCAVEATGTREAISGAAGLGDVTRCGVMVGTATGGLDVIAEQMEVLHIKGPRRVSPFTIPQLMDNAAAAWIALRWGFRGPAYALSTACSSGVDTIGLASAFMRSGRLDGCLAGGAEGALSRFALASFDRAGLLTHSTDPTRAMRPFDRDREGKVLSEGGAQLFLETRERAEARGAPILARVLGYGSSADVHPSMTRTGTEGAGLARAMRTALDQAGIQPSDIGYIAASGSGMKDHDIYEAHAIHTVMGDDGGRIPVGASQSVVGYTMATMGTLNAIAGVLAVSEGLLSPVMGFENPDDACRLNVVAGKAREQKVDYALVNAFGFCGETSALVLGAP